MTRLFYFCVVVALGGCTTDISHDPGYHTDYVVGAVFRVKRPLVLHKRALYDPSINSKITGVSVPPGTLLRVSRLERQQYVGDSFGTGVWVWAHIIDGVPTDGEVNLSYVSKIRSNPPSALIVDTNILEKVSTP